jgi:hypothetical protein
MSKLFSIRGLAWALVCAAVCCLPATAAPPVAPAPERVTIKKTDGTTVAGELASADHDGVAVRAGPKAPPVKVAWKDLASISNGLTRNVAITRWKADHDGKLCGTCMGDRTIKHEACAGTGIDPASKKLCAPCNGGGTAGKCTVAKCAEGKVDCPGPCLKLSVGLWKMKDGLRIREFKSGGGTGWVSEHHVGEVWVFKSNGPPDQKGKCTVCQGTAKVECGTCQGKGKLPCKTCGGVGMTGPACKDCQGGRTPCKDCKATGLTPPNP